MERAAEHTNPQTDTSRQPSQVHAKPNATSNMSTDDRSTCRQLWRLRCNKFTHDITTPTSTRVLAALQQQVDVDHKDGGRRIWWGMG